MRGLNDLQNKLLADLRSNSRGRSTTNNPDVSLLEAIVGAADAKEHESEEDDGAHNQKDLKLSERLQCRDRIFRESERLLLSERCSKKTECRRNETHWSSSGTMGTRTWGSG